MRDESKTGIPCMQFFFYQLTRKAVKIKVVFRSWSTPGSNFEWFENVWTAVPLSIFGQEAMSILYYNAKYFVEYEYAIYFKFRVSFDFFMVPWKMNWSTPIGLPSDTGIARNKEIIVVWLVYRGVITTTIHSFVTGARHWFIPFQKTDHSFVSGRVAITWCFQKLWRHYLHTSQYWYSYC